MHPHLHKRCQLTEFSQSNKKKTRRFEYFDLFPKEIKLRAGLILIFYLSGVIKNKGFFFLCMVIFRRVSILYIN